MTSLFTDILWLSIAFSSGWYLFGSKLEADERKKTVAISSIISLLAFKLFFRTVINSPGGDTFSAFGSGLVFGTIILLITWGIKYISKKKLGLKKKSSWRCDNCGAPVDEEDIFCKKCGEKFE